MSTPVAALGLVACDVVVPLLVDRRLRCRGTVTCRSPVLVVCDVVVLVDRRLYEDTRDNRSSDPEVDGHGNGRERKLAFFVKNNTIYKTEGKRERKKGESKREI